MFGLSFSEVLIVLVVALLVLGPERLPKVARSVGKGLRDLRRTTGGIREILEEEIYLDEAGDRRPAPKPTDQEEGPVPRAPAIPSGSGDEATAEQARGQEPAEAGGEADVGSPPSEAGPAPQAAAEEATDGEAKREAGS